MQLSSDQRSALGTFLRAKREALSARQFGLPVHGRRRTPGLRREEVAQMAGLSTTWYSWLEQGRDMSMSAAALSRLADALTLSAAERDYLFELSRHRDPRAPVPSRTIDLPPLLHALVEGITSPAYVIDRLWRARCWNAVAADLLAPWLVDGDPCLLRFMFLDPAARSFISDWDDRARRLLAEFRADTAHMPEDPDIAALVADLTAASSDFAKLWHSHRISARAGGLRLFDHPRHGRVEAEQMTLSPDGYPDHKLVILLPNPSHSDA